jgi:hypothetical protein
MAMRGERGIGEREHARVYQNARSDAAARKQDERVCGGVAHDRVLRCTKDERARWSAVVPLALEKRLFLNVRRKYLLVPLRGKKPCDINKQLSSF